MPSPSRLDPTHLDQAALLDCPACLARRLLARRHDVAQTVHEHPYGGWLLAVWTETAWRSTDPSPAAVARGFRAARAPTLERLDVRVYGTRAEALARLPLPDPTEHLCPYHHADLNPEDLGLDEAWIDEDEAILARAVGA